MTLQIGSTPCLSRYASTKLIMASIGGRAPPGQICAGLAQDLVGLAQLAVLALQRLQAFTIIRRNPGLLVLVGLSLVHPPPQRLCCAADLRRNRHDRCPLRGMLAPMFDYHPDGALPNFGRKMWRL